MSHIAGINLDILGNDYQAKTILDYGCGPGSKSFFFVKKQCKVIGVDVKNYLYTTEYNMLSEEEKENFTFILEQDFAPNKMLQTFDYILCREVLEHIEDTDKILSEFKKMLKESGKLIISIPSSNTEKIFSFFDKNWLKKCQHVKVISKNEMLEYASKAGFKLIHIEHQNFLSFIHWLLLTPIQYNHDMGSPKKNEQIFIRALKIATFISKLPIIRQLGIRFFPKSIFYYFQ